MNKYKLIEYYLWKFKDIDNQQERLNASKEFPAAIIKELEEDHYDPKEENV